MLLLSTELLARLAEISNLQLTYSGFGDGSDGEVNLSANTTIPLAVNDIYTVVYQATKFTLNAGYTISVDKRCRGILILSHSDIIINGIINLTGKGAYAGRTTAQQRVLEIPLGTATIAVPQGADGGAGGRGGPAGAGTGGYGSSGSVGTWFGGGFGGGGGGGGGYNSGSNVWGGNGGTSDLDAAIGVGGSGGTSGSVTGKVGGNFGGGGGGYHSSFGIGAVGGTLSGGGGGGGNSSSVGGSGGGIPGGCVMLIARGNIVIGATGQILCNGIQGSAGGSVPYNNGYGGGGGSGGGGGGVILLAYKNSFTNSGVLQVNGGSGGSGGSGAWSGYEGFSGTAGTVGVISSQNI
ncbi:MAG: hypothetical protein ACOY46_19875 [Bacillota bacterium]